jgi:outer membrane lipoprotein SlyB
MTMVTVKKWAALLMTTSMLAGMSAAAADCKNCGYVKSVDAVKVKGQASGGGAVAGGLVGGLVGNQFGRGSGRTLATVAGAAGGAYAGNEIEKNAKSHTVWKVAVEMDYGERRTFTVYRQPDFLSGDRVQVVDGKPVRVANNK